MDLQGIAAIIGSIAIPLVLFYAGRQIAAQRERSEARNQQLQQISQLIDSLSSTNSKKRMIALQLVRQLEAETSLPPSFLIEIGWLAVVDDPSGAGAAQIVLGSDVPDIVLLLDFFGSHCRSSRSISSLNTIFQETPKYKTAIHMPNRCAIYSVLGVQD